MLLASVARAHDGDSRGIADTFRLQVINAKEVRSPISSFSGTSLLHVRAGDIYILAVTKQNVNAALVFSLLNQFVLIFRAYFGGKLDEDRIRKNFVLIYELLDGALCCSRPLCCFARRTTDWLLAS